MPYIPQDRRFNLDVGSNPDNPGELNYLLTMTALESELPQKDSLYSSLMAIVRGYVEGMLLDYSLINEVVGALTCAKLEYCRRKKTVELDAVFDGVLVDFYLAIAAPYEDKKIKENGDIFGYAEGL